MIVVTRHRIKDSLSKVSIVSEVISHTLTHSPLVGKVLRVFLTVKNSRRSCATIGERINSQHGLIFGRNKVGSIASHLQRSQVSRGAVLCGLN